MMTKSKFLFGSVALTTLLISQAALAQDNDAAATYASARTIVTFSLSAPPGAEVRCLASATTSSGKIGKEVVWDPTREDPLQQQVRFPGDVTEIQWSCGSAPRLLSSDPKSEWLWYSPHCKEGEHCPANVLVGQPHDLELELHTNDETKPDPKAPAPIALKITASAEQRNLTAADFRSSTGGGAARARSLDPLSSTTEDLLRAIAGVAVDRASASAMALIKDHLLEALKRSNLGLANTEQLLSHLRFEDLASRGLELERALIADIRAKLIDWLLAKTNNDPQIESLLRRFDPILQSYLDGSSIPTERDFQTVVYDLGDLSGATTSWQRQTSMLATIAAECVADGTCTADVLTRDLQAAVLQSFTPFFGRLTEPKSCSDERTLKQVHNTIFSTNRDLTALTTAPPNSRESYVKKVLADARALRASLRACRLKIRTSDDLGALEISRVTADELLMALDPLALWPQSSSIAARFVEVLQPPPGTSARSTATVAAQVTFDVLDHAIDDETIADKADAHRALASLRSLTVATITGDTRATLLAALSELGSIAASDHQRSVEATEALGALVEYSSSYSKDADPKTSADDRKKALSHLVDALTDRSNRRRGELVISAGAMVAIGGYVTHPTVDMNDDHIVGVPALTLPFGLAFDTMPEGYNPGFHLQLNVLDVAQYLNVSTEGEVEDPGVATAVDLGLTLGFTLGSKNTPFLVALDGGWQPGVKISPDAKGYGQAKIGVVTGFVVPFLDFN